MGMNISQAAQHSGLPVKTIRYYEEIGLVSPARQHNGYRTYSTQEVEGLHIVQRARSLGFSMKSCRALLGLYEDKHRASADVKRIALERIAQIDCKLKELTLFRNTLVELVKNCAGDEQPQCFILDELVENKTNNKTGVVENALPDESESYGTVGQMN